MLDFVAQKKEALLLAVLLAGMLALMGHGLNQDAEGHALDGAVASLTAPVVNGAATVAGTGAAGLSSIEELRHARDRSRALSHEVSRLRTQRQTWEEERRENVRLRRLLGLQESLEDPTVAVNVIAASPLDERTILVDRGRRDGIEPGMPVVSPAGVVGRVILSTGRLAKVLLITEPSSGLAVAHQDGRYQGMIVGVGTDHCALRYLSPQAKVAPGDLLVTTGLDRIYPAGLPAGRVISVTRMPDARLEAEIRPEADLNALEEVLVVITADPIAEPAS